jgi:hypothetical protein
LELSWAWFARFLLPKMALGASWGCFWFVLGAPEGLLRVEIGLTDAKNLAKKKRTMRKNDPAIYHFSFLVVGS